MLLYVYASTADKGETEMVHADVRRIKTYQGDMWVDAIFKALHMYSTYMHVQLEITMKQIWKINV